MSRDEFAKTLSAGEGQGLYYWDPETLSKYSSAGVVAWPIVWLLSHHYKHIHGDAKYPLLKPVVAGINAWRRRVLWRHHVDKAREYDERYGDGDDEDINGQYMYLLSKIDFKNGRSGPPDPHLGLCADAVAYAVTEACKNALSNFNPKRHANTCEMVRAAHRLLRLSGLKATKMDKDGGFAVTEEEKLTEARRQAMQSVHYKKTSFTLGMEDEHMNAYKDICGRLANNFPNTHQSVLLKNLLSDCHNLGSRGFLVGSFSR